MTASIGGRGGLWLAILLCVPFAGAAFAEPRPAGTPWLVRSEWVKADEDFLAGDALSGRGSATNDEAIAAAYIESQFESFGLVPAPGMRSFGQSANIVRFVLGREPLLEIAGRPVTGLVLLTAPPGEVRGRLVVAASDDPAAMPEGGIIAIGSAKAGFLPLAHAASLRHVRLLIAQQNADTDRLRRQMGGETRMPVYLEGETPDSMAIAILPQAEFDRIVGQAGQQVSLTLPAMTLSRSTTSNAIGFLPGTDPNAGLLLLSAHLDHLGRLPDGTIMHGADDDASGASAVLELARALAAGPRSRRGIVFVCYGSEETGGFGSRYFAAHPPVPLSRIAANIEFEMIGAQDPKLPAGTLMMTGFERSSLGETLAAHGALVTSDPYPDQHFFERSDNYQLALKGVVAHTISGWAVTPVYHQPTDTIENLDIPFMTRAIQSLIEPVRWLAESREDPQWKNRWQPQH